LVAVSVGSAALSECRTCGVWADPATFEEICTGSEARTAILERFPTPGFAASGVGPGPSGYCPCPVCKRLMNRQNFAHCSGVILDICKSHGVWFDGDELHRVVEFVQDGGLLKARRAEKESLEEERRKLRQAQYESSLRQGSGAGGARALSSIDDYALLAASAHDFLRTLFS
jgi:Zn-finger nucleic acid-binding protein